VSRLPEEPARRRGSAATWVSLGGLVLLAALLVWTSLGEGQIECEVCVAYGPGTQCRKAAGKDRDEAMRAAQDAACATLASGRAASMECSRVRPVRESCTE
jgi:hypothetical protein